MNVMGITRRLDDLGRVVIPMEMRRELGWSENAKVSMVQFGHYVLVKCDGDQKRRRVPKIKENPIYQDVLRELCVLTDDDLLQILELVQRLAEAEDVQNGSAK